ncbi:MAG: hypothetical protein KKB70_11350 [Proteobacteria bacterium]|nr:hypothetical protein [Pseudomonadota bacterium]MBU1610767.1 hypothetical protein [Pseudomonadota bacterium]
MENPYELHLAYRRLFESANGHQVMEDLERRGFYREPAFSGDPARLAFNEGRRSLVLHVKQMLKEHNFIRYKDQKGLDETKLH